MLFRFLCCLYILRFVRWILNLVWVPIFIATKFAYKGKNILVMFFDMPLIHFKIFDSCLNISVAICVLSIVIAMIQEIGKLVASADEATLCLVFSDKDFKFGKPVLIRKRKINKKHIIFREFYITIPMKRWREEKEVICERMNMHLIDDFKYGGTNNADGNRIVINVTKGRKSTERGVLYDDTF